MAENSHSRIKLFGRGRDWFQGAALLLLWLIFSGRLDFFHVATGVVAVLIVLWLDRKLGPATLGDADVPLRPHLGRILLYIPWLVGQMFLSAVQVGRAIIHPEKYVNPRLVEFRTNQPHILAKVVLGNSITLTPGTLTLDIAGDSYLVHALSDDSVEGLFSGEMQRRVALMFHGDGTKAVTDTRVVRGTDRVK